ncbi:MAG: hypothetical protein MJ239_05915, partial [Bacilli bacterium]|nr:hypothetical protein [Bacilli bacterium]
MMKKLFKSKSSMFVTALLGAAVIAFGASASAFTYTWFSKTNVIDNEHIGGNTTGAYYRSGTGTSDDPYIIDSPIHLRNLAWLQYLGEYNKIVDGQYNQTYFKVVKDLDMSNYVLPPIGTTANPFIGNFDGDGHTIANLRTTNDYSSMTRVPDVVKSVSDVNVIGFFGVIGDPGDVIVDSAYDLSINELKNFNLQGNTVIDTLPTTLIGITAGFVNAPISAVTMAGCTVTVPNGGASAYNSSLTTNLSNYTSLGYCTDKYRSTNRDTKVEISNADPVYTVTSTEGEGEAGGWGGSIDMKSLYNRLDTIWGQSTSSNFRTKQTNISTYPDKASETSESFGTQRNFMQYSGGKKGKASFSRYGSGSTS